MNKYIDAEKLKEKITEQIKSLPCEVGRGAGTLTSKGYGMMEAFQIMRSIITSLQQEQPEVDLEKEIEKEWETLEKDYSSSALDKSYVIVSGLVGREQFSLIARHFYELRLNARKEE